MIGRPAPNPNSPTSMDPADQEKMTRAGQGSGWRGWSTKRKVMLGAVILLLVIAIAVGVGVGLTVGRGGDDQPGDEPAAPESNGTRPTEIWRPAAGTTWNYELLGKVESMAAVEAEVWDVDLFDNDVEVLRSFQSQGIKVICYFSAGSYEDWREDKAEFQNSDLGNDLAGWEGERWLDTRSANVRRIMRTRLDLAAQKRCDGVEPDNVDGYGNDSGLDLAEADAADYVTFLANEAHARNLSIGLKNAGAIVGRVVDLFEFSVQEQCQQYNNCDEFTPFIRANKPVFHVEYPKGDSTNNDDLVAESTKESICGDSNAVGFSTIIKNMKLDEWVEPCPSNQTSSAN